MTAREVIEQIKALPPEERARVIDFVEEVRALQHVRYADRQSFDEAAAWTLSEHAELMRKLSQ